MPHKPNSAGPAGFTLLELLVVVAVVGLIATLAMPSLITHSRRAALDLAAEEIRSGLHATRAEAVRSNRNAALRFEAGPTGSFQRIYRDGDGDGVRTADIRTGTDRPTGPPRSLGRPGLGIHYGFPPGRPPRDPSTPGRRLDRLDDPIRFNNSNLASFDPLGTATPGSVYLTDGHDGLLVVRVLGRTGRIRILRWHADLDAWRER